MLGARRGLAIGVVHHRQPPRLEGEAHPRFHRQEGACRARREIIAADAALARILDDDQVPVGSAPGPGFLSFERKGEIGRGVADRVPQRIGAVDPLVIIDGLRRTGHRVRGRRNRYPRHCQCSRSGQRRQPYHPLEPHCLTLLFPRGERRPRLLNGD